MLNSYYSSHPWTEDFNRGLNEKFLAAPVEIEVWTEFLEHGRPDEPAHVELAERHVAESLRGVRLDLIVAVDDDALRFLLDRGERLFPGVPVVYCGELGSAAQEAAKARGWTGLPEQPSIQPWVDLALRIRPGNRRLVIVTDNAEADRARRDAFKAIAGQRSDIRFEFLDGQRMPLPEILAALRQVPPEAVVIATTYSMAPDGGFVSPRESGRAMAEASRAPILCPNLRYPGTGILAGSVGGGRVHGALAGELALRVLEGGGVASMASEPPWPTLVVDHSLQKKFGLTTEVWPAGTAFVNFSATWRESYRQYAWWIRSAALLILFQTLVTAALIVSRRRLRRTEAELTGTRDRMARGQEIAHLGTWERNLATGVLTWSDEVYRIYGFSPGEIVPTLEFVLSAIHPEDAAEARHEVERADLTGADRDMEHRMVRRDGSVRRIRIKAKQHLNARGERVLMGSVQDVTEVRAMEEQIRHAQRMESVGNLAGGIAHDFNNLLTVINGYSDVVMNRLQPDSPIRGPVGEIRKAGAKAAELTGKLLAFSRKQMIKPAPLDVNGALLGMEGMLTPLLGSAVKLHYDLESGLPLAFLDHAQFEQTILNLASNSRDAMGSGGEFTLATRLTRAKDPPGAGWIEVLVRDTGEGMSREIQKLIFDPFFTTKPKGKGTGLGLASVYGFVKQSGGQVSVESEPGEGATIILRLPATAPAGGC